MYIYPFKLGRSVDHREEEVQRSHDAESPPVKEKISAMLQTFLTC